VQRALSAVGNVGRHGCGLAVPVPGWCAVGGCASRHHVCGRICVVTRSPPPETSILPRGEEWTQHVPHQSTGSRDGCFSPGWSRRCRPRFVGLATHPWSPGRLYAHQPVSSTSRGSSGGHRPSGRDRDHQEPDLVSEPLAGRSVKDASTVLGVQAGVKAWSRPGPTRRPWKCSGRTIAKVTSFRPRAA